MHKYLILMVMHLSPPAFAQVSAPCVLQWEMAAVMSPGPGEVKSLGVAGPVTGVLHDLLVVGGGANFPHGMPWQGGQKKYRDEIHVFKKQNGRVKATGKTYRLPAPVAYAAVCTTPKGIVYAGGENNEGILSEVVLLAWEVKRHQIIATKLPALPEGLTNAAAASSGNKVYIAGGETKANAVTSFYTLDLDQLQTGWQKLPDLPKPLSHSVLLVQTKGHPNCVYLVGGRKKNDNRISDLSAAVYEFHLVTLQWKELPSLPYALSAASGIAGNASDLWIFGGDKGTTFLQTEKSLAAIKAEKAEAEKQALIFKKNQLQETHPGFSNEVLRYNIITGTWTTEGTIPFETPVTTTAVQWGEEVIIPSGEIRAGVRTPQILKGRFKKQACN